ACLDPVWMRAVTAQVRRYFYQPRDADRAPITGLVLLHFVVAKDGQLAGADIARSSGSRVLDDAALDILRLAAPLPAIPDAMHAERIGRVPALDFGGLGPPPSPDAMNAERIGGILPMEFGGMRRPIKASAGSCGG